MFKAFRGQREQGKFAERNYLDERTLLEIARIKEQIELIVNSLGVPIASGGSPDDYLCAVSRGLIQFVCAREERGVFRTLMAEKVQIHPGSVMFKESPDFIVAGEIVRTTRMYAMSVSPLKRGMLARISPIVADALLGKKPALIAAGPEAGKPERRKASAIAARDELRDFTNKIKLGGQVFDIVAEKKRKKAVLEWSLFKSAREALGADAAMGYKGMLGVIKVDHKTLLDGEKLETILKIAPWLDPAEDLKKGWPKKVQFNVHEDMDALVKVLDHVLQISYWKPKNPELGFVALFNDGEGTYWFRVSRGFHTAINESVASLETLVDELAEKASHEQKETVGALYRKLSSFFD
jgi:ATP-dependent helicase HrpA